MEIDVRSRDQGRQLQFDNREIPIIYPKPWKTKDRFKEFIKETKEEEKEKKKQQQQQQELQLRKEHKQYAHEVKISDGFDVGSPPPSNKFSGFLSAHYITCYHKPPYIYLHEPHLDNLLCLSKLAICLYNIHQGAEFTTYYDSVQVVKAMQFGCMGEHYNITFQASLPASPPVIFETRVFTHFVHPYNLYEIVFVRKFKCKQQDDEHSNENQLHPQEIDFIGDKQNTSQFHYNKHLPQEHLSDFDEKYAPYTDSGYKLPLYLSQLVLNEFNMDRPLEKLYHNVNVLNTKISLAAEEGATYLITFEASLPHQNPQTFQTKIPMSPLVPPTKIKIKSVTIMPN